MVLAIDGAEVSNTAELLAAVSALKPRAVAEIALQRGAQPLLRKLTVAQRPAPLRRSVE